MSDARHANSFHTFSSCGLLSYCCHWATVLPLQLELDLLGRPPQPFACLEDGIVSTIFIFVSVAEPQTAANRFAASSPPKVHGLTRCPSSRVHGCTTVTNQQRNSLPCRLSRQFVSGDEGRAKDRDVKCLRMQMSCSAIILGPVRRRWGWPQTRKFGAFRCSAEDYFII